MESTADPGRRAFLRRTGQMVGALASGTLLSTATWGATDTTHGVLGAGHHRAKAKRVIYLFQGGGPSQIELFDYKPELVKRHLQEMPPSVMGQSRLTSMSANQSTFPLVKPLRTFAQHGQSGAWVSELMPHTARIVDELSFIRTVHTEPINHIPAVQFAQSGSQLNGRPCIGAWLSYGLGADNRDLPPFIVMHSMSYPLEQPIDSGAWSNGFLPSQYQGVRFLPGGRPVVFLENPAGISDADRRRYCAIHCRAVAAAVREVRRSGDSVAHQSVRAGLSHAELRFRKRSISATSPTPPSNMYGPDARAGTFAYNCTLRGDSPSATSSSCSSITERGITTTAFPPASKAPRARAISRPRPSVMDLKQRGLLEDTLVIWGGEFGRTSYSQGSHHAGVLRTRSSHRLHDLLDGGRRSEGGLHARRDG